MYPLYTSHAHLWPLLAPLDSYEEEMVEWVQLLEERFPEEELEILDLGTGGGHHLYHLFHQMPRLSKGMAIDLSGEMLERVSNLLPQVETMQGDMITLNIEKRYPVVSVHDSFCYLHSADQVKALFQTIGAHLTKDGIALVKVDAVKDSFQGPYRYLTNFEEDDFDITLTHYEWDPEPSDSKLEVLYHFIETKGAKIETREETHTLGLFSKEELMSFARVSNLEPTWHELERWDEDRENLLLLLQR